MYIYDSYQREPSINGKNVLLVEHDADSAKGSSKLLADIGLNVFHASNLRMALEFLEDFDFDIVLFDVVLPDGTGSELLNKIRFRPKFANSSLVAMTHFVNPFLRRNYLAKGVDAYFEKPLCRHTLARRLQLINRS